jgi:hypothetical protein
MTFPTMYLLQGALFTLGLSFLALAAILWVARQVYWWRRLSSACGSEASAQATVRMVEADSERARGQRQVNDGMASRVRRDADGRLVRMKCDFGQLVVTSTGQVFRSSRSIINRWWKK